MNILSFLQSVTNNFCINPIKLGETLDKIITVFRTTVSLLLYLKIRELLRYMKQYTFLVATGST